jgi:hypothetical protein
MNTFWLCLTAFITSFIFTYIGVWNSKRFSNYFFLVRSSAVVITYCFFYGLLAVGLYLLLTPGKLTIEDQLLQLPGEWALAFGVGMITHGVADLNFFNIRHAGESFPIGLRSFSRYAEAWFERQCDSVCFERFLVFIEPYRNKYRDADLASFKDQVVQLLSAHPSPEKIAAFTSEVIAPASSPKEIIDGILREFGKNTLETIDGNMQTVTTAAIAI